MKIKSMSLIALFALSFALPAAAQKDKDNPGQDRVGQTGGSKNAGGGLPGQGRGQTQGNGQGPNQTGQPAITVTQQDRTAVYGYSRPLYTAGNCPPGLAKKNNGCLPPGQAKKLWAVGQPLPTGVAYYPLPGVLLGRLTPAPSGYEYVRVANDVLMMAIGTRLIVGAIADLGSM